MKECIIYGAGKYGEIYAAYLEDNYKILGFIDDNPELSDEIVQNYKVLGGIEYLLMNIDKSTAIFVPIGDTNVKEILLSIINKEGFETPNYIHPSADIDKTVKISGSAIYILQNTTIMPYTELKEGVMISAGTIISHHTIIEANVFISFGVNVGASLTIKRNAYLGIGCTIMTGVRTVGENSFIGAGAVVINDVPDRAVVVGNPGRIIRYKE